MYFLDAGFQIAQIWMNVRITEKTRKQCQTVQFEIRRMLSCNRGFTEFVDDDDLSSKKFRRKFFERNESEDLSICYSAKLQSKISCLNLTRSRLIADRTDVKDLLGYCYLAEF